MLDAIEATMPTAGHDAASMGDMIRANVGTGKVEMIPWGWPSVDRATGGGIAPGYLCVVGAYPGIGKTSFILGGLANMARKAVPCELFSCEMTRDQLVPTIIGRSSGISPSELRARGIAGLEPRDRVKVADTVLEIANWPLRITDATLAADEIAARSRVAARKRGAKIAVVDYLQLLKRPSKEENRRDGIDRSVNCLKRLAQESGMAVILLSQLAVIRDTAGRYVKATGAMLKESGGIFEAADMVLTLNRPHFREWHGCANCGGGQDYAGKGCDACGHVGSFSDDNEMTVSVEKNRIGDTGFAVLRWNGPLMTASEKGDEQ
jgi:replicative DNA helicase